MNELFRKFAALVSGAAGGPWWFVSAMVLVITWVIVGWVLGFPEKWIFVITTPTAILTFLMVFLIQNAQNRHAFATQLKLDELIRAVGSARNHLIDLEHLTDEELSELKQGFERLRERATSDRGIQSGPTSERNEPRAPQSSA